MKNKQIISPIGLKGNQIHERQLSLMGIKPINESENKGNHAVELTKIGPDGNAYAIIRENHEYYIKKTDKTTGLMLEDFKYIGGLQNKKNEAYPSYAKAIKQLNLKFKSLAEAYNRGGDINVFEDDNLLEHHPLKADMDLSAKKGIGDNQEYVVDKKGTPLSNKAKVGKEKGQFGDNLADGKACDDCEEVKVNEAFGMGFTGEGNLEMETAKTKKAGQNFVGKEISHLMHDKDYPHDRAVAAALNVAREKGYPVEEEESLNEFEQAIEEMMARYDEEEKMSDKELAALGGDPKKITQKDVLLARGVKFDEESHGGQHNLDVDDDGVIRKDDLKKVRAGALGEVSDEGKYTWKDLGGFGHDMIGDFVEYNGEYYKVIGNGEIDDENGEPVYSAGLENVKNGKRIEVSIHDITRINPNDVGIEWWDDKDVDFDSEVSDIEGKYNINQKHSDYFEESIEEAIKRLDALLEGELKKKALK